MSRVYLFLAFFACGILLGFYAGKGCTPEIPTFGPANHMPNGVVHTQSVEVKARVDSVKFAPLHGERVAGRLTKDSTWDSTYKCAIRSVSNGDTLDLVVTSDPNGCVLDWWSLSLAPRPVIVKDVYIRDSVWIYTVHRPWLRAGLFAETNILHGLSLRDAAFGIRGQINVLNLSLYAQPQYDLLRGFEVKVGLLIASFEL